jgi:predicted secreted protein
MKRFSLPLLCILVLSVCRLTSAAEDTPLTYDRIDLSASAQGEVANDILVAVLFRELEGANAAPLADEVNKSITQAIKRIRQVPEIKVQTVDYQTLPVYQKERITGWRVRQAIRLETADAAKLSALLGELQQQLNLQSIGYSVSPAKRKEAEDTLIAQALKSFQQRAELVTRELGRARYRIVALRVDTGGPVPRPPFMAARAMAAEAVAPPSIEAGEQKVEVNVSGTIELQTN